MSLPSAPLVPTANNPQGVGHPNSISQGLTLLTNGPDTSLLLQQENITTPGASCSIALAGGPVGAAGSFPGMANYTLFKGCGPSAGGVNQDALHLYRYGPTGAVNPSISQVIQIAPKMAATPNLGADNLMQIFADVNVAGALTSSFGSFGASNPPASIGATPSQYVLGVFGGWRVVFGWNSQSGADATVTFGTAYTGLPIVLASVSDQGTAGDSQIVRLSNITRANFNIHAEALDQTGGGGLAVAWIAIGQA